MAADSVAVVIPNRMTDSTTNVSTPSGITDAVSCLRISSCSVHAPVVEGEQQGRERGEAPEPPVEMLGDMARSRGRGRFRQRGHLLGRAVLGPDSGRGFRRRCRGAQFLWL